MSETENSKCEWQSVIARTPKGKTRTVRQCVRCKRIKYPYWGAIRFVRVDGTVHESRTVDESDCTT